MATPTREQIREKAEEILMQEQYRNGLDSVATPEYNELVEGGYTDTAKNALMANRAKDCEQLYQDYCQTENLTNFTVDVPELFNDGCLILGSKHSGKSDLGMMISDKVIEHKAIVTVFDPSGDWEKRSGITKVIRVSPNMRLEPLNESMIYDLSLLSPSESVNVVESYAKTLFQTQAAKQKRSQIVVVFEECHLYFSNIRSKQFANCVRLLSVGRNISITCVLISQFACMVDKYAVRQVISQFWLGWTKEPNDLKYLRQIIGEHVKEMPKLEDGHFLYGNRRELGEIQIQPYVNNVAKEEIKPIDATPQPTITPKAKQTDYLLAKLAVVGFIGLLFLLSMLGAF
jgi:hypothetical protein